MLDIKHKRTFQRYIPIKICICTDKRRRQNGNYRN